MKNIDNCYEKDEHDIKLYRKVADFIEQHYGIELTWSEISALGFYFKTMDCKEVIYAFMFDYFGLDSLELGQRAQPYTAKCYGMNLLGTEEFRKYCRRHVQEWREERTMP